MLAKKAAWPYILLVSISVSYALLALYCLHVEFFAIASKHAKALRRDALIAFTENQNTTTSSKTLGVSLVPTHNNWAASINTIHLIGERHSGTNWIYNHLKQCFGTQLVVQKRYTRGKHWFQYPEVKNASILVALFRHPLDWTFMNYVHQYHCYPHARLSLSGFLTTPWTMSRFPDEASLNLSSKEPICTDKFRPDQVTPCFIDVNRSDYPRKIRNAFYEHRQDGSGPYASIVDLRADKIRNFLEMRNYVPHFLPYQYEYLVEQGTTELLEQIEQAAGVARNCRAYSRQQLKCLQHMSMFVEWMQEHVDWDAEALVGYNRTYYDCDSRKSGPVNSRHPFRWRHNVP